MRRKTLHIHRWIVWLGIGLSFGVTLVSSLAIVSAAASESLAGGKVRPGRITHVLVAGEEATGTVLFENTASKVTTSQLSFHPLAQNPNGDYVFPKDEAGHPVKDFVILSQTVAQIPASDTLTIDYRVRIPARTAPGDYLGALLTTNSLDSTNFYYLAVPFLIRITDPGRPGGATTTPTIEDGGGFPTGFATAIKLPDDSQTQREGKYALLKLTSPFLSLTRPSQTLVVENQSDFALDAPVDVNYRSTSGQILATLRQTTDLLLPDTERNLHLVAPDLRIQTPLGQLPYIGRLDIQASVPDQTGSLRVQTWAIPWWFASLLFLGLIGLGGRILSLHPAIEPSRLAFRYQGRLSLSLLLLTLATGYLASEAPTVTVAADPSRTYKQVVTVTEVMGFEVYLEQGEIVINSRANYDYQINTPKKIYRLTVGEGKTRFASDQSFLFIARF